MSPDSHAWSPSKVALSRAAYRRSRARRSLVIAAVITVVVATVTVWGVLNSTGWPRFQKAFLNLSYGKKVFPDILNGLWLNIRLMLLCGVCIVILAMLVALMRNLRGPAFFPLRALATIYTDVFRGVPLILVLLLLGFGVPSLRIDWLPRDPLFWGCASLILVYGAYVSEVFRAGIESVHPSQRAAARSLGLSHGKMMRYVVVPQAVRRVMPPLLNDMVALQKDTGLLYVLGAVAYDAILRAKIATAQTFNYTPYVVAGILFILITIPLTRLTDFIARRQGWVSGGIV
ncbi:amino acid ABC transporter permease [Nakamurella antarctica]|uniref:Amino acid ABC transporter permease n=1 Tax=Nakamurella antarctica TaxID=1902245 RepID=A0A3G8ZTA8_9ACTN|nr:amino acid ABC transporter permease [Nakamurella antarctica]AZI57021.1 amino acid ABC transporter permease [Nakamurella antarctica]